MLHSNNSTSDHDKYLRLCSQFFYIVCTFTAKILKFFSSNSAFLPNKTFQNHLWMILWIVNICPMLDGKGAPFLAQDDITPHTFLIQDVCGEKRVSIPWSVFLQNNSLDPFPLKFSIISYIPYLAKLLCISSPKLLFKFQKLSLRLSKSYTHFS